MNTPTEGSHINGYRVIARTGNPARQPSPLRDMYVEQLLRDCEVCNRRFAVQYEFSAPRVPSSSSDRVTMRVARCPSCGHRNPLIMLMYAYHVVVKSVPGPEPMQVRVRPNTLRRLWMTQAPNRSPRLPPRKRIALHLMVTATLLMHRFRPFLP
jgi:hypothetical protein